MTRRALAALALLLFAAPAAAKEFEIELLHDGQSRRAEIVAPDSAAAAPALLALHGGGGSPRQVRRHAGFTLSERGWVEIYPAALDRNWNDGRSRADGAPVRETDDSGFLRALLEKLASDGLIDPARVYVAGASNGGMMTTRLACDAPDLVAGAAIAIASWPVGLDCPPGRPIPALIQHGTDDGLIPFAGGEVVPGGRSDRGRVLPADTTLRLWAARNRCGAYREALLPDRDPQDGTRVRRRDYLDCAAPLTHMIVDGGGHAWPGARDRALRRLFLGRASQDLSLTDEIQTFFLRLDAGRQGRRPTQ